MKSFLKGSLFAVLLMAVMATGCSPQARKARHLAKADKFFDAGQYPQAEVEYLNVVSIDANDPHAVSRLGVIYFEDGRYLRAYPFLNHAKSLDPNDLWVRVKSGYLSLALGRKTEARDDALAVLAKDPKYPEAARLLVEASDEKDLPAVQQRLEDIVKQAGVSAESEMAFGSLASRTGNLNEALKRFTHAQSLDPKRADAPFGLGAVYWMRGDLTNANQFLKQAADLSPARSPHRLSYADFKLKTGAVEEGKQLLLDMTRNTPDYILAWSALGETALAQQRYDECATIIGQIQARDPDNFQGELLNARLKLVKATTHRLAGRSEASAELDDAIVEYERLAMKFKTAPQIFFHLGFAYLTKDDFSKALRNFSRAVELNPTFDDALLQQAQLNIQKENPDPAIASMNQLIKRRPQQAMAYLLLAGAYAYKNDFNSAIAACRQLETVFPDNPQIPYAVGGFFLRQNKNNEARAEFSKSLALSPAFLPAMEQLVNLDLADKNYASALGRVNAELEKHPDYADVLTLRGKIFLAQSNVVEAEKSLRKAVELDTSYSPAYLLLADLYVQSKRNDEALRELNQVVSANPRDVTALTLIGMIQGQQGNDAEARDTYERLLQINPNSRIALNNLAVLYSEKFNLLDKAFEAARKARELAPYDPAASDTLGWVVFKRGDYSWALSLLQASAERLPNEPEVSFHLGMAYYMLNDETRARNALTRALAANRDFPGKEEARKRMAMLSLDYSKPGSEIIPTLEKRLAEQPDDPIALSHLASVYEKNGEEQKAAQVYEQVLKGNANNPKLLVTLARLYSEHLKNDAKAMELAREAYRLAPRDPDAAHVLGDLVFASGQFKWALTLLENAQKESADPQLLYDLAVAQYSVGQVAEAESSLREVLRSNPTFGRADNAKQFLSWITLASDPAKAASASALIENVLKLEPTNAPALMASVAAAESRGDLVSASAACEQVLKLYPEFTPALKKLAIYYSEMSGKGQRAYEVAMKAREVMTDDADVARALAIVLYQRGDFQNSVRLLTPLARGSADGKTLFYLGMSQFRLKHIAEAKTILQQALAKNLSPGLADEARQTLAQIK